MSMASGDIVRPGGAGSKRLDRFRELVHEQTGIRLSAAKDQMIESRLRRRLIALNLPDVDTYLAYVFEGGGMTSELGEIVDLLTTNKTDFFREIAHFDLLERRIIPEALAVAGAGRQVRFRFWSAAASTGAEAWSAAMLLDRAAREDDRLRWAILGTDISNGVLASARKAVYPAADLAPVPGPLKTRYVMSGRGPAGEPLCRIVPELRARVRFERMNLTEFPYRIEDGVDVCFLRNVLIYFEPDLQRQVVAACAGRLRPGGYLVVGHSESMIVRQPDLTQVVPGAFIKSGGKG